MDISISRNTVIDEFEPYLQICVFCGSAVSTHDFDSYFIIEAPGGRFDKDAVCTGCACRHFLLDNYNEKG